MSHEKLCTHLCTQFSFDFLKYNWVVFLILGGNCYVEEASIY